MIKIIVKNICMVIMIHDDNQSGNLYHITMIINNHHLCSLWKFKIVSRMANRLIIMIIIIILTIRMIMMMMIMIWLSLTFHDQRYDLCNLCGWKIVSRMANRLIMMIIIIILTIEMIMMIMMMVIFNIWPVQLVKMEDGE